MKDLKVDEIPWTETLELRQKVLRPGLPPKDSHFVGDEDPETFHLGLRKEDDSRVLAIASFVKETNSQLGSNKAYRLRGMAVDPEYRRLRLGEKLLKAGEEGVRSRGADLLWFNARESAFSFYKACGYETLGELFDIPGVGPHKVMFKRF